MSVSTRTQKPAVDSLRENSLNLRGLITYDESPDCLKHPAAVQALAFQMMEALEQSGALNTFEHVGMATMDAIPQYLSGMQSHLATQDKDGQLIAIATIWADGFIAGQLAAKVVR
jgi:hypothetical protein